MKIAIRLPNGPWPWPLVRRYACIALSALVVAWTIGLAMAQQQVTPTPMVVTSDTTEYCHTLADRLQTLVTRATVPEPPEVVLLSDEGQRMCSHGQTRGGIMRLRQAILMMQREQETAAKH